MWIVANGALKSGSTWIFQLLATAAETSRPPNKFQEPGWQNASVARGQVNQAAAFIGPAPAIYVTKQHWARENSYLLGKEGVKVINIVRDMRDVVVSRYHHDVRAFGFTGGMDVFLHKRMEDMVAENVHYHSYWINSNYANKDTYYVTSYEYLLDEYEKAATALFDFCDFGISPKSFQKTLDANLFANKPKTGDGEFFRKGKAGTFSDDLTPEQSALILDYARNLGFGEVKRKIAAFNPALAPYLAQTDLGLE